MKTKIKILLLILFLITPASSQAQDTLNVLFLGNSYTQFNLMPVIFQELSESGGYHVWVDLYTPGGYTLEGHSTDENAIRKIERGYWNYVILQEQSQIPSIDYLRYNMMYPAAEVLDSTILANNAQTGFFMTWGRKYGGQQNWGSYSSPVFEDFFHMQDSLSSAYTEIAEMLGSTLCPVGNAWATAVEMDSLVDLWQEDNSHPSLLGSYLTACVFYSVLHNDSPVGLSYTGGLSVEDALFMQTAAEMTVLSIEQENSAPPVQFTMMKNYPNPFNATTVISFQLQAEGYVSLDVFDVTGRVVGALRATPGNGLPQNQWMSAGHHEVVWDASGVASGVYLVRLSIPQGAETQRNSVARKVILVK